MNSLKKIVASLVFVIFFAPIVVSAEVDINAIQDAITAPLNYVRDNKINDTEPLFHIEPGVFTVYHINNETFMVVPFPEGSTSWVVFYLDSSPTLWKL